MVEICFSHFSQFFELSFFVSVHQFVRREVSAPLECTALPLYILPLIYLIICTLLHLLTHSLCHDILQWNGIHNIQRDINEDESIFLIQFKCFLFRQLVLNRVLFSLSYVSTKDKSHCTQAIWKCVLTNMIDLQHQTILATFVKRVFES